MATRDWRYPPSELRQLALLEYIEASPDDYAALAPFYDNDNERFDEARADVQQLDTHRHINNASGMGLSGLAAGLSPQGRGRLEGVRTLRQDKAARRQACRVSLIEWLYDVDAVGSSGSIGIEKFFASTYGLFAGQAFTLAELDHASAWLKRNGLVDGGAVAEFEGPTFVSLTDAGLECAEEHNADVSAYLARSKVPAGSAQPVMTINAGNVQVATGQHSSQVMNVAPDAQHIAMTITGLASLLRALGLVDDEDEQSAEVTAAVDDVVSEKPSGSAVKKFLGYVRAKAMNAADPAITHVLTNAADQGTKELQHLLAGLMT